MLKIIDAVLDVIYPRGTFCVCCSRIVAFKGDFICPRCRKQLDENLGAYTSGRNAIAAHPYAGIAGAVVRAMKYNKVYILANAMSTDILFAAEKAKIPAPDVITYVSMHPMRRIARFSNHAQLVARKIAEKFDMRETRALIRVKTGRKQASISNNKKRAKNMEKAFHARMNLSGKRVWLIDDVYTTGATSRACAEALYAAGAKDVWTLTYSCAHPIK